MARASAKRNDLFDDDAPKAAAKKGAKSKGYSAQDIEVLEGLEPVRRRPGMYIGGTDEKALHHLFAEVLDNSMDEAVAGHAKIIKVTLEADGSLTVEDDGRGIPVDPHPKFKSKSALEVIMTTLHAGGKFSGKAYETSGGLHGVGVSVVNALAEHLEVTVARDGALYKQTFSRGLPTSKLKKTGTTAKHGTTVSFHPDPEIFGAKAQFKPARLYRMARSKAYLFAGVKIRWACAPELLKDTDATPAKDELHFPNGLADFLAETGEGRETVCDEPFAGRVTKAGGGHGTVEWALTWYVHGDAFIHSYCNTVPTTEGGTHEAGLRAALSKGLRNYGELVKNKRASIITADDVMSTCGAMLSVFIREPEFQGQTKEKLSSSEATRLVEAAVRDHFDHWLTTSPQASERLLTWVIERADERLRRKQEKEVNRKAAGRKLRLPGKLADCARNTSEGTELFLVEGDSAGGSAKQARDRATQAILPLRGKILNVASAGADKLRANQELSDLMLAMGCGTRDAYKSDDLRYDRIIIMTDADVDGAHIASLLITFFYREIPQIIREGRLYLAMPPLYRLTQGGTTLYARDDAHKDELMKTAFKKSGKVDIGRFKGLGEMMPAQLKETTMRPGHRTLLRMTIPEEEIESTGSLVEQLMGRKAELRFQYIQENARFVDDLDL